MTWDLVQKLFKYRVLMCSTLENVLLVWVDAELWNILHDGLSNACKVSPSQCFYVADKWFSVMFSVTTWLILPVALSQRLSYASLSAHGRYSETANANALWWKPAHSSWAVMTCHPHKMTLIKSLLCHRTGSEHRNRLRTLEETEK